MLHLCPELCLVPRFSLEKGNFCQGTGGSRRCAGVRCAAARQAGAGGGVARSRDGGGRTSQGLELVALPAAGQGWPRCPQVLLAQSLLSLPGGEQHTQTPQQQPG